MGVAKESLGEDPNPGTPEAAIKSAALRNEATELLQKGGDIKEIQDLLRRAKALEGITEEAKGKEWKNVFTVIDSHRFPKPLSIPTESSIEILNFVAGRLDLSLNGKVVSTVRGIRIGFGFDEQDERIAGRKELKIFILPLGRDRLNELPLRKQYARQSRWGDLVHFLGEEARSLSLTSGEKGRITVLDESPFNRISFHTNDHFELNPNAETSLAQQIETNLSSLLTEIHSRDLPKHGVHFVGSVRDGGKKKK